MIKRVERARYRRVASTLLAERWVAIGNERVDPSALAIQRVHAKPGPLDASEPISHPYDESD